jgi:hypothetical protein
MHATGLETLSQRHQTGNSFVFEAIALNAAFGLDADRACTGANILGDAGDQFFELGPSRRTPQDFAKPRKREVSTRDQFVCRHYCERLLHSV